MRNSGWTAFICVVAVALSASATAQTEPNSFLMKPAPTHAALMQQIKSDEVVMNRFMRHFGMTREEVIEYFSGLKLSTIKESGPYLVYNTPETGEIRARVLYYKKGTKVWVDSTGNYIL